jgi:hypothetical protein
VSDSYLVRSLRIDGNQRFEMLFQDRDNATTGFEIGLIVAPQVKALRT